MAQKTIVQHLDDLDGSPIKNDNPTVSFGLDDTSYEIDLNDKNAEKLRGALSEYISYTRKARGGPTRRSSAGSSARSGTAASAIREWAKTNGHNVPERGRIPNEIREAYEAAH